MNDNLYADSVGIIKKDIYIIKNDINNKVYIGQAIDSTKRFRNHCKDNKDNSLIDKAIKKYGKEHFWVEILETAIENFNEREKYWIMFYNSLTPNGYNILEGGNTPPILFGDDHPNVKLSDNDLILLKKDLSDTDISLLNIAKKYNISKKQVLRINQGISRASLTESYPIRKNVNINGKLTEEDVDIIIELLKYTYRFNGDIAREFGVEVHAISRINEGKYHRRDGIDYPIRKWKSSGIVLFTYEQVTEIINLLQNTKKSINSIAKVYNVSTNIICRINQGKIKKYYRNGLKYPLRSF